MNRKARRKLASFKRCIIRKGVPFGRVRVVAFETGEEPRDDRTVYQHFTKGLVDRRTTIPLLDNLITVSA